jgi:hypothetical protein
LRYVLEDGRIEERAIALTSGAIVCNVFGSFV